MLMYCLKIIIESADLHNAQINRQSFQTTIGLAVAVHRML